MNEVKWIKLSIEMFDNRKIRHLRKLPDGNNIVLIWVMLLTLAGKCNAGGMIFLTQNIPYTTKMLADELDFEENTVKLALEALESFGMISTNGFLSIIGWEEHQNEDALSVIRERERIKKQKYRDKQKQKQLASHNSYSDSANDYSDKTKHGDKSDMSTDMSVDKEVDVPVDMSKDFSLSVSNSNISPSPNSSIKEIGVQGEEEKQEPKKETKKPTKKEKKFGVFEEFAGNNAELLDALNEYEKMRNEKRKPMTDRSRTLLVNRLRDKFPMHQWIAIVDQSTLNGWDSVYPLKDESNWGGRSNKRGNEDGNVFFQNAREMVTNEYIGN